jgi:ABC-2 type transport system permease protein
VSHSTLTGTGTLVRLILRRDRVRLSVWVLGITLLVLVTASSIRDLYPTQADLDTAAETAEANAALIALQGPAYALDTLGGQVVFNFGAFGFAVVALMGMFLVGRHTRADEEAGRTELLRATVVGRNAPVTAVLLVAAGAYVVLGALATLSLVGQDLPATGSVAFGLAIAGFGFLFACITAVAAQAVEYTRPVYGLVAAVLGVSYVLRAVGDAGSGTVSWLSPMGWAQGMRAFAGERWWPLLLLLGWSALMIWAAHALLAHRDLGGGLLRPRLGAAGAGPLLASPLGLAFRLQRWTVVAWVVGMALAGISYGTVVTDIGDLIGDNSALDDLIAQGSGSLTETFLATTLLSMALIGGGFAVSSTLRLRSEETSGHGEAVLATTTSRPRWSASHLLIALAGSVLLLLAAGLGLGATYGIVIDDPGQVPRLTGAALAYAPALWVIVAIAFFVFGFAPRAVAVVWAVFGLSVVIGFLGELLQLPSWLRDLSPFQHVPAMPADGFTAVPLVALTVVAAAVVLAGMVAFGRRDAGY